MQILDDHVKKQKYMQIIIQNYNDKSTWTSKSNKILSL